MIYPNKKMPLLNGAAFLVLAYSLVFVNFTTGKPGAVSVQ
jgi:hypothetical protein